jgi:hypothetical protein
MSLFHFLDIGLNLPLEHVGHFLAQAVPAGGPIAPVPGPGPGAGDSAFGIEQNIIKVISQAALKLANNDFFKAFNGLMLIVGAWLFIYRLLITGFLGYFTEGQGVLRKMIVSTVGGIIILMFALHPEIVTQTIQGAFFMLRKAADEILLNPEQGYDLQTQINAVADAVTAAGINDPLGIIHGLVWLVIVAAVIVLVAIYYVHLIEALIYLLIVVPFFARAAFVGLLSKYTSGWFWAVMNAGLVQLLKPVLSRIIIFLVLSVMAGVAESVKANAGNLPILSQLQGTFGVVFGFLVVLAIGIVMMFKVPTIAKVLAISANGAARDIAGTGFALDVLGAGLGLATAGKVGLKGGAAGVRAAGTGAGFGAGALSGTGAGRLFGAAARGTGNVFGSAARGIRGDGNSNWRRYVAAGATGTGKAVNAFSSVALSRAGITKGYSAGRSAAERVRAVNNYRDLSTGGNAKRSNGPKISPVDRVNAGGQQRAKPSRDSSTGAIVNKGTTTSTGPVERASRGGQQKATPYRDPSTGAIVDRSPKPKSS